MEIIDIFDIVSCYKCVKKLHIAMESTIESFPIEIRHNHDYTHVADQLNGYRITYSDVEDHVTDKHYSFEKANEFLEKHPDDLPVSWFIDHNKTSQEMADWLSGILSERVVLGSLARQMCKGEVSLRVVYKDGSTMGHIITESGEEEECDGLLIVLLRSNPFDPSTGETPTKKERGKRYRDRFKRSDYPMYVVVQLLSAYPVISSDPKYRKYVVQVHQ